jgi:hypothetical protein
VDLSTQDLLPEAVLHRRLVKKGNRVVPQVLVKWTNLPETSATWEDWHVVKTRFPDAVAWGNQQLKPGRCHTLGRMRVCGGRSGRLRIRVRRVALV